MDAQAKFFHRLLSLSAAILGVTAVAHAEPPLVVFDLPLTVECRDVTPQRYEASYQRKIFEAIIKISPELAAGKEKISANCITRFPQISKCRSSVSHQARKSPRILPTVRFRFRPTITTASCWCITSSRLLRATGN